MTLQQRIILLTVSSSIFFEALDIAIVNLAMPLIQQDFGISSEEVQWVQTLYILFYGGFLILGGKLADIAGRRLIFIIGSAIFLITSFGAGLAPSFQSLVVLRAIQGIGAAFVIPSAFSIVTNTFVEPISRNKAIGIFGSFAAIGSGSGLSIGGLIATYFGWEWIFFINVPVIGIAIVLAYLYIPKDVLPERQHRPDVVSGVILTLMILVLTYFIHEIPSLIRELPVFSAFLVAVIFMGWWLRRRLKRPDPLIKLSLFKKRAPLAGYSTMLLLGAFFSGYLFLISMIFQLNLRFTAAQAGFILLPFSILSAIVSKYWLPGLMRRISVWNGALIGMGLMAGGGMTLIAAILFSNTIFLTVSSALFVTGTGIAVCFMTLNVLVISDIPETDHGLAGSIGTMSFFFGGSIGLTLIGLAMQLTPGYGLPAWLLFSYAMAGVLCLLLAKPRRIR